MEAQVLVRQAGLRDSKLPPFSQKQVRGQKGANEAGEVNLVNVFLLLNPADFFFSSKQTNYAL